MAALTCNMRSALQSSPPSRQVCTSNASRSSHITLRVPLSKAQSQTQTVSNADNSVKHRQLLSSRSSLGSGSTPNSFLCRMSPLPTTSRRAHKVSAMSKIIYENGAQVSSLVQMSKPPAALGSLVSEVETPAIIVDLEAFERNCDTLRSIMKSEFEGVRCRPHAKMHKCAEVAALQLEYLGDVASGVCAQTITEAEAMVAGGIKNVLVTNQIVTPGKLKRLAKIAKKAKVSVVVDALENVLIMSAAMKVADASVTVLVEVNIGQDRCGVDTPAEAVALALAIKGYSGLEWGGIHAYHGGIQHIRSFDERKAASDKATARAGEVVEALQAEGHGCPVVTGGGTGTFHFEGASGVYTELQPGSFFFGDGDYNLNEGAGGPGSRPEWEQAIFVATTVISASKPRVSAVVDAGSKAVSMDSGAPVIRSIPWLQYSLGGDEHGVLGYKEGAASDLSRPEGTVMPAVGQMLRLVPGHVDPTVNMHDWLLMFRGDRVQDMYRIGGRGAGC